MCAFLFLLTYYYITSDGYAFFFNTFFVTVRRLLIKNGKNITRDYEVVKVHNALCVENALCYITIKIDAKKYLKNQSFNDNCYYNL